MNILRDSTGTSAAHCVRDANNAVNDTANIRKGGRPTASVEQLMRARDAARKLITAYCERTGIKPPRGMETQ